MGNWASYHAPPAPQTYARCQLNAWLAFAYDKKNRQEWLDPLILEVASKDVRVLHAKMDEWVRVLDIRDIMLLRCIRHAKGLLQAKLAGGVELSFHGNVQGKSGCQQHRHSKVSIVAN